MLAAYQAVQATTADPARLLLMLLDGGATFLDQALRASEQRDRPRFLERVSRAHAVIAELAATLDHGRGGDIATSLDRLYDFMLRQLTVAQSTGEPSAVLTVRRLLATVRAGFDGALGERPRA